MNPRKAINLHCRECVGFLWQEDGKTISKKFINGEWVNTAINNCAGNSCELYDLRNGAVGGVSKLKQIRKFCLTCLETFDKVRNCTCGEPDLETNTPKCPLFDYRFGIDPKRQNKMSPEQREFCRKRLQIGKSSAKRDETDAV